MPRILEDEIVNDPLVRGYSIMTDAELLTSLNAVNRTFNITSLAAGDVSDNINQTEWNALTNADRTRINELLARTNNDLGRGVNLFGRDLSEFQEVFGPSTTATSLNALRTKFISRSEEIGWKPIVPEKDLRIHTIIRAVPA